MTHSMDLMAGKTSSSLEMIRGFNCSNLWMASLTKTRTSAAASSLVSLRNSISCKEILTKMII